MYMYVYRYICISKKLCYQHRSKGYQYQCRANYKHIYGTNKTNTIKQLLISCTFIRLTICEVLNKNFT